MPFVTRHARILPVRSVATFLEAEREDDGLADEGQAGRLDAAETVEDDGPGRERPVNLERELAELPDRHIRRDVLREAIERERRAAGGHGLHAGETALPEREDGVPLVLF